MFIIKQKHADYNNKLSQVTGASKHGIVRLSFAVILAFTIKM